MRTLAVIPARLGATRLPRKPLRLLAGLPLVFRVWERVSTAGIADDCVIATDSAEVATAMAEHGAPVVMTRTDHPSGTDRVAEVATRQEFRDYGCILNVQGDEPFVSTEVLASTTDLIRSGAFTLATAAAAAGNDILFDPNVVKVVADDAGRALYFSRAPIPFLRQPDEASLLEGQVRQHVGVYAYHRDALARWVALAPHPLENIERLEQLRPLAAGMAIGVAFVGHQPLGGIDTEEDLARANSDWTAPTQGSS
jgi:3-deoxy-manno-octulosonate cytidylyltransferase (CMP-KDO synthetase)